MTLTIDIPAEVADTLTRKAAQEGWDIAGYVRQLVVLNAGNREEGPDILTPRIPGLHAGQYWIAEDFDAPLPDSFWLGEESAMGESGK